MRYASIRKMDISNGEGIGVSLFVQGCPIHCKGCFQPETWDFNDGKLLTEQEESIIYNALKPDYITRFSVLGGEPLVYNNLSQLNQILLTVKTNFPNKKIWIWTGYTWDELQEQERQSNPKKLFAILQNIDYLVCGPFIESEKDLTLRWRGSRNQQVIDIPATLEAEHIIKYIE